MKKYKSIDGNKNFVEGIDKLNPEQQLAFNNLKKAFDKCLKLKIFFYNNYGTLGALDSAKINRFDDDQTEDAINEEDLEPDTFKLPCNEWADDAHYFHPTRK